MAPARPGNSGDALLSLLLPFWRFTIGGLVLLAVAVALLRLAGRGRSRMTTAMLVTGAAVTGLAALGVLFSGR